MLKGWFWVPNQSDWPTRPLSRVQAVLSTVEREYVLPIFVAAHGREYLWLITSMTMPNSDALVIETSHLSFGFQSATPVVQDLNIQIPRGAIYGFLGPNGAGKTTTIRLLLNLLTPSSGTIAVFGQSIAVERNPILSRIGALIETPSLYDHLTSFDNLWITARLINCPKSRVLDVLGIVRLSAVADKYVHTYSLGMKQRLGLAMALLSGPDLLILDEPTNGLDPTGIIEIRELLIDLNVNHQVTILVSSHLLAEVEKLVSHIGIIDRGKMRFQGSLTALQTISRSQARIELATNDNSRALKILLASNQPVRQAPEGLDLAYVDKHQLATVISVLTAADLSIHRAQVVENTLEQTFLSIINQS